MYGAWGVVLEDLRRALDLSPGPLGVGLTIGAVCSLPVMIGAGQIIGRWGARNVVLGGALAFAVIHVGLAWVPSFDALIVVLMLFAATSGFYDVGINAAAIEFEHQRDERILPRLHALFAAGAAVGAFSAGVLLFLYVPFRAVYLLVTGAYVGLALLIWRAGYPRGERVVRPAERRHFDLFRMRPLVLIACVTSVGFFLEGSMETWSVIYLRSAIDLPPLFAATSGAVFYLALMVGRLTTDRLVRVIGRRRSLEIAGISATLGLLLAIATTSPFLILAGILVVGLALSGIAPITFSLAGDLAPGRAGEASAVITSIGYLGFLIGPSLLGTIAELTSLRVALLCAALIGTLITVLATRVQEPPHTTPASDRHSEAAAEESLGEADARSA